MDGEMEEWFLAYRYCKLFGCSMNEYEHRPFKETLWLLKIDETYQQVVQEKQEEAQRRQVL